MLGAVACGPLPPGSDAALESTTDDGMDDAIGASSSGPPPTASSTGDATTDTADADDSSGAPNPSAETDGDSDGARTTDDGDEPSADADTTSGSTGGAGPGVYLDPLDSDLAGADIVSFGAYLTDDEVSLRLSFAGPPLQGAAPDEVAWAHWYLDLDPLAPAEAPFGAEVVIGIYDSDGAILVLPHGDTEALCPLVEVGDALGLEIRFPRSVFPIDSAFEAAATVQLGDAYDLAPDDGTIDTIEVDVFPPWDGSTCDASG